ncbi:MAG: hypothetical protein N2688_09090 [Burkholderiaceae bacterium]|nr:hypothetical protein [Burkholderiaceae bacterium]
MSGPRSEREARFDLDAHVARVEQVNAEWRAFERGRRASDAAAELAAQAAADAAWMRFHRRMERVAWAAITLAAFACIGVLLAWRG